MRQIINGRVYEVPGNSDGEVHADDIRQAGDIGAGRTLIKQSPGGANEMVNPGDTVRVNPGDQFIDAPLHKRGG